MKKYALVALAIGQLFFVFLGLVVKANIDVIRCIFRENSKLQPLFFDYKVQLKSP